MARKYPIEKKNQIIARILSKEITIAEAHRQYGVAESSLHHWLNVVRTSGQSTKKTPVPLPQGMNLRAAIIAEGYCHEVGFDSPLCGKYCRSKGITVDELKAFSAWFSEHDADVVLSTEAASREQELVAKVNELAEAQKNQGRELLRKEKALAEAAALLVLTKKAQAIWGDKEK